MELLKNSTSSNDQNGSRPSQKQLYQVRALSNEHSILVKSDSDLQAIIKWIETRGRQGSLRITVYLGRNPPEADVSTRKFDENLGESSIGGEKFAEN